MLELRRSVLSSSIRHLPTLPNQEKIENVSRPSANHDTQRFGGIFVPDVHAIHTQDGADFLWDELVEAAREGAGPSSVQDASEVIGLFQKARRIMGNHD
jgi:hypothetical protein